MVPLEQGVETPKPPTWRRCRYVLDCRFIESHAIYDVDDVLRTFFSLLLVSGITCGAVVAPIYLARATQQVYGDTCLVTRCDSYAAVVISTGFGVSATITTRKPCANLVDKQVSCYVKLDVDANSFSVSFNRPSLVTAIATGIIGWSILLAMLAWFMALVCRHSDDGERRKGIDTILSWAIVTPLLLYGLCTIAIAIPFVVSITKSGLVNDLCHVNGCKSADFANVHVEGANVIRDVYLSACAGHINSTIHCYRKPSGAVTVHLPNRGLIIGLATSGGIGLLVSLVHLTTKVLPCIGWFHHQLGLVSTRHVSPPSTHAPIGRTIE